MKHVKNFESAKLLERLTDIKAEPNGQKTFQIPDQGIYVIYEENTDSMTIQENISGKTTSIKINDVKNFIQKLTEL